MIAVLAVIALGVMLFVASAGAYVDLRDSYTHTRHELALADLHVDLTDRVTADDVAHVATLPGVALADAREIVELPVRVGADHAQLRLLSLPEAGQPVLDRVLVLSGSLPGAGEVLIEKHFADKRHLARGSSLDLLVGGAARRVQVAGVAVSAEYLWVARDRTDFMPDPAEFGVGWMRASELADFPASGHQLLVELHPDGDAGAVERALGSARVIRSTPEDQLVGVRLLQLDVDGYRGMAAFFPIFFLAVGAFIVAAIMARLVDAQRALVGTLMALGVGRTRMLGHYIAYGLVLGGCGALAGVAAGTLIAPAMTHAYAKELGIPFVTTRFHGDLAGYGLVIGIAVSALAALVPALHASRLTPAVAMRPPRPNTGALARAARHLRGPLPLEMAIRDVLGRPLRSVATALGVAGALVVVLTTGGLLDSMRSTFGTTFHDARRDDLRVDFAAPSPHAAEQLAVIPGVRRAEGLVVVPATLAANGHTVEVVVQGLRDDAFLVRSIDADGTVVPPTPGDVVLTRGVAHALHVAIGDRVKARLPLARADGPQFVDAAVRVAGFADAAIGPVVSMRSDELARALRFGDAVTTVALAIDPAQKRDIRTALAMRPDVARVEDTAAVRDQMNELMSLGWVLIGAMLVFGSILAAAILFSTATLGVLERRRDLATLRALGRTSREIALALTLEHALLALAGLAIGIPAARLTTRYLVGVFSSDLFALPFVTSPITYTISITGVFAVLLLAQWPALRSVARMSLADSVRSREG
ncbi:MAG TPA: FtsX-like permease family protein [Kofleriaceae bacterium]|nr:FtsX-like permease family protein [Kofleriaceae bacterium]